jgi:hypothetical protein
MQQDPPTIVGLRSYEYRIYRFPSSPLEWVTFAIPKDDWHLQRVETLLWAALGAGPTTRSYTALSDLSNSYLQLEMLVNGHRSLAADYKDRCDLKSDIYTVSLYYWRQYRWLLAFMTAVAPADCEESARICTLAGQKPEEPSRADVWSLDRDLLYTYIHHHAHRIIKVDVEETARHCAHGLSSQHLIQTFARAGFVAVGPPHSKIDATKRFSKIRIEMYRDADEDALVMKPLPSVDDLERLRERYWVRIPGATGL